ncbi:hypothetical protein Tco_1374819 [Tanacetum coccineum]
MESLASGNGCSSFLLLNSRSDFNSALHVLISRSSCLYDSEISSHLCLMSTVTVVVSGVPRDGSRVHTHDHDGSEALDESHDLILCVMTQGLLGKNRPPPPPSILSLGESSYPP